MSFTAYKYKQWDKYTKKIITHQELYFSSPKDFNDLFDCQACGTIKDYNPILPPFSFTKEGEIRYYEVDPIAFLNNTTQRGIDNMCGVCCFSKSYNSILMWAHYANYNRGVCFKFDLHTLEKKISGLFFDNVEYVKRKPLCDYSDSEAEKYKWFISKYRVWKYEKEVRGLIFSKKFSKNNEYRKIKFPKEALKEIIFGPNSNKKTRNEIICLCHQYGFNKVKFSLMQASTNSDSYKLQKVPFTTDQETQ